MVGRQDDVDPLAQQCLAFELGVEGPRLPLVLVTDQDVELVQAEGRRCQLDLGLSRFNLMPGCSSATARMVGATIRRKADWNAATRTVPLSRPAATAATSASAASAPSKSRSACLTRTWPASVSRTLRPTRSRSGVPVSRSSTESCWETALGV